MAVKLPSDALLMLQAVGLEVPLPSVPGAANDDEGASINDEVAGDDEAESQRHPDFNERQSMNDDVFVVMEKV